MLYLKATVPGYGEGWVVGLGRVHSGAKPQGGASSGQQLGYQGFSCWEKQSVGSRGLLETSGV